MWTHVDETAQCVNGSTLIAVQFHNNANHHLCIQWNSEKCLIESKHPGIQDTLLCLKCLQVNVGFSDAAFTLVKQIFYIMDQLKK